MSWSLTIILISAALVLPYYLVFRDVQIENSRLEATIQSFQNSSKKRSRRMATIAKLRNKYVLSHDGITPGMASGLEPLLKEWVENELDALGEIWRQDEYY